MRTARKTAGVVNNLILNSSKTEELIIDFRKHSTDHNALHTRVPAFTFLRIHITDDLSSQTNSPNPFVVP